MKTRTKVFLSALACSAVFALGSTQGWTSDAEDVKDKDSAPASQEQPKISLETIIAKVNGKPIKMVALVQELQGLPPQIQQIPLEKIFPRLRDQLIDSLLIAEAAKKQKLTDSEEVKRAVAKATERALIQAYMMKHVKDRVTEPSLKAKYDEYVKNFKAEKEVRARHILVKDEPTAQEIIAELKKGGDFADLAKKKSTDQTAKEGGDLGFFKRDDMVSAFSDVAFNLKPGTYTESPVKTEFGFHVIRVEETRDSKIEPFEKKKDELASELSQETVMKAVESLRSQAKIERFDEKGQLASEEEEAKKSAGPRVK